MEDVLNFSDYDVNKEYINDYVFNIDDDIKEIEVLIDFKP